MNTPALPSHHSEDDRVQKFLRHIKKESTIIKCGRDGLNQESFLIQGTTVKISIEELWNMFFREHAEFGEAKRSYLIQALLSRLCKEVMGYNQDHCTRDDKELVDGAVRQLETHTINH